ncbi:AMP-binding protein [Xanthobacter dioxanivorans]|uniref:AMP-binding protein n=1 Tax=Xanthobacter dioxanivorans TaxID=2528964 RepID=A0A974SIF8_9HYPH|nr:AMP-binding protein [Xanthobacter dioxanivorans]QRG07346.1 AMP-binding protein [Xanthobacter dioxanivorans]
MNGFYDAGDRDAPDAREARLLALIGAVAGASVRRDLPFDRAALEALPILRKSDLPRLQAERPPFGGLVAGPVRGFSRLFLSPGPICEPQLPAPDGSNAARALHAAGFRAGQIVLNTFNYHLTPGGLMMDEAARALRCAVIPAGASGTEQVLQVLARYRPEAYVGTADHLNILAGAADAADIAFPILRAAVAGAAVPATLRAAFRARGIEVFELYGTAELGIVAYETDAHDGFVVNEGFLVEILDPATGAPVPEGEVGELVVTRPDPLYPLLRFATGDLSAVKPGTSPCGRTAVRIRGWLGRADDAVKVKGMFVHPSQVAELLRLHPEVARARLVISRASERDVLTLEAEVECAPEGFDARLAETLRAVTRLGGGVRLLPPGTLAGDGRRVVDERRYD